MAKKRIYQLPTADLSTEIVEEVNNWKIPVDKVGGTTSSIGGIDFLRLMLLEFPNIENPYTNDQAKDAVGNSLRNSSTINFLYDTDTREITAEVQENSIHNGLLAPMPANSVIGNNTEFEQNPVYVPTQQAKLVTLTLVNGVAIFPDIRVGNLTKVAGIAVTTLGVLTNQIRYEVTVGTITFTSNMGDNATFNALIFL